jgi:ubiquinone/menaquinone biosynthesis C-methylase UbiE
MKIADLGCGSGFFAIPAAEIVGPRGAVYCVDVNPGRVTELKESARKLGLENIVPRVSRAEETVFCTECLDVVFFGIVLHDFEDPIKVLKNARQMIKPGGVLVNLDWKREPMNFGPPHSIRFSVETASGMISSSGFRVVEVRESGPRHYLILAEPT